MQMLTVPPNLATTLQQRRIKLASLINCPIILWSGQALARNFPANRYPFRASSHFLYFAGIPLENAAIRLDQGKLELFLDNPPPGSALWHGEIPTREEIAQIMGADKAYPLTELLPQNAATIPVLDGQTLAYQQQILQRSLSAASTPERIDLELTQAIIKLRLSHDEWALAELRQAAQVSIKAHKAAMSATFPGKTEAAIRASLEQVFIAHQMTCAYNSIVTVHGEILHNEHYHHLLQPGDLLLVDAGAETANGWAADITRTWPVTGAFSATQREIYQLVLAAHDACIDKLAPGVEYQEIHLLACQILTEGLVDLNILKGNSQDLVAQDAHALFFPHGIGHLLGLDVHDMEDFWDLAGYAEGRARSKRFGLGYLRLNRPLQPGMLVTIEPGFYQVPGILNHSENRAKYQDMVNWEQLEKFQDVRGIRIEDDVLITEVGTEVLTADLPNQLEEIEALVSGVR